MQRNVTLTLIIDAQKDFVYDVLGSKEAQNCIPGLVQFIKEEESCGSCVIFTRDTHSNNYMNTREGKYLPVPHCIENTEGWKVCDELLNASITKYQVNKPSFGMTQERWREVLYEHFYFLSDVQEIKLVGFCTDICVISNALSLKAMCPEANVTVYEDLCAGVTPQKHEAALEVMRSCQINVEKYFNN